MRLKSEDNQDNPGPLGLGRFCCTLQVGRQAQADPPGDCKSVVRTGNHHHRQLALLRGQGPFRPLVLSVPFL